MKVGWLVGCFGFNGPLRQYFRLYRAVSQREGERGEKRTDESKNVQTTPTRTYYKRSRPLPYCNPNCNMKVCCEYTQYTFFNTKKKIILNYPKSTAMGIFSKGLKNELERVEVNEPSVFELLKVNCRMKKQKIVYDQKYLPNILRCYQN